jgi:hypothetical protein
MFLTNQPDETFITQFAELGITDSNEMITILNGFEQIAEIGYEWYVNNNLMKRTNTND